ncbi:unnamed protein product [marine sediment metagenome]|uniref:Uncharacterized protein n=1 Tax=marine sediment metagenome TaxID=412755 RepID=X0Y6W0_9ZZZZ
MVLSLQEGHVVLADDDVVMILTPDIAGSIKLAAWWREHPVSLTLDKSLTKGGDHGLPGFNYDRWAEEGRHKYRETKAEAERAEAVARAFAILRVVEAVAPLRTCVDDEKIAAPLILRVILAAEELAGLHGIDPKGKS